MIVSLAKHLSVEDMAFYQSNIEILIQTQDDPSESLET
jgi:hypothetical protein